MNELLSIEEYCRLHSAAPEFLFELEQIGLIEFVSQKSTKYISIDKLNDLERFRVWHYELHINVEGIDVIQNLLAKQREMNRRISELERSLKFYE